jgi:hypothetical protein
MFLNIEEVSFCSIDFTLGFVTCVVVWNHTHFSYHHEILIFKEILNATLTPTLQIVLPFPTGIIYFFPSFVDRKLYYVWHSFKR